MVFLILLLYFILDVFLIDIQIPSISSSNYIFGWNSLLLSIGWCISSSSIRFIRVLFNSSLHTPFLTYWSYFSVLSLLSLKTNSSSSSFDFTCWRWNLWLIILSYKKFNSLCNSIKSFWIVLVSSPLGFYVNHSSKSSISSSSVLLFAGMKISLCIPMVGISLIMYSWSVSTYSTLE